MIDDFRFALRSLLRTPGSVAAIILILGLGIGVNTAMFSLYDGIVLRELPYAHADRLVLLQQRMAQDRSQAVGMSPAERTDYQAVAALDAVEEFHTMSFTLLGLADPVRVQTGVVSAAFFDTLGVRPLHGRSFVAGEDSYDAAPLMLLSYEFWRDHAGGDPSIVGSTLTMNDKAHEIIGVLPPITQLPNANDVYITLAHCPIRSNPANYANRDFRLLQAVGRLAAGSDLQRANLELATMASRISNGHPEIYAEADRYEVDATPFKAVFAAGFVDTGMLLLGVAGLILLAALANVSNLALARLGQRGNELGVRSSFGAPRARIARLLLIEHLLLGLLGGTVGVLFALLSVRLLKDYMLRFTPLALDVSLDLRMLAFAVGLSILVGLLAVLLPTLSARLFARPLSGLGNSRGSSDSIRIKRVRASLIVAQLAVTLIVATAASMLLRSLAALDRVDPGFQIEQLVSARVELNTAHYSDPASRTQFSDRLLERLGAIPELSSASVSLSVPMQTTGAYMSTPVSVPDRPDLDLDRLPPPDYRIVDEHYLQTLGIPLLRGRPLNRDDDARRAPVALVNESMARLYWPNEDPVGRRFRPQMNMTSSDQLDFEVVGVVADVRQYGLREAEGAAFYGAFRQGPVRQLRITARASASAAQIKSLLREQVRAIDPNLPVDQLLSLRELRSGTLDSTRLMATLIGAFAALVGLISAIGLGGLIAYDIEQRGREFCIRMALGAELAGLIRLMLWRGLRLTLIGLLAGLLGAALIGRGLGEFLYATESLDLLSILAAALLLLIVALIASLLPARRLSRVKPASALGQS